MCWILKLLMWWRFFAIQVLFFAGKKPGSRTWKLHQWFCWQRLMGHWAFTIAWLSDWEHSFSFWQTFLNFRWSWFAPAAEFPISRQARPGVSCNEALEEWKEVGQWVSRMFGVAHETNRERRNCKKNFGVLYQCWGLSICLTFGSRSDTVIMYLDWSDIYIYIYATPPHVPPFFVIYSVSTKNPHRWPPEFNLADDHTFRRINLYYEGTFHCEKFY